MSDGNGKQMRGRGSCGTCEYSFKPPNAVPGAAPLQCRRHAPTVVFMGMAQGPLGKAMPMTNGFFAPVSPDIWCGEFRPQLGAADFRLPVPGPVWPDGEAE